MKQLLFISSLFLVVLGCRSQLEDEVNLEGDLYYTWLKLGSFYGHPDSLYQEYIEYRDSIGVEELIKEDSVITISIQILEKNNLIKSPFIYLKTETDSLYIVYMTPEEYKPLTKFTYKDLIENNEKVKLKLITEPLTDRLMICKKVLSIEKVRGETLQEPSKLKIEDYR